MLNSIKNKSLLQFVALLITFKILFILFFGIYFYSGFKPNSLFSKIYFSLSNQNPYESFSFLLTFLASPWTYFAIALSFYLFKYCQYKTWFQFENYKTIRLLIIIPIFILAFHSCFAQYNYFANQYYILEKLIIIILAIATCFRPYLVPLFLAMSLMFQGQFIYPIPGYLLFDKRILFDILIMFIAYGVINRKISLPSFFIVFSILVVIVSNYFYAGISKVWTSPHGYEWVLGKLDYSLIHVNYKGWSISKNLIVFAEKYGILLQSMALLIELSSILFFLKKRYAYLHIATFLMLHLGIFLMSGCFFWKWVALDFLLVIIIAKVPNDMFSLQTLKISFLAIITCHFWLSPFPVNWHPTKVNQSFAYEIAYDSGEVQQISKQNFAPFDNHFHHGKFHFLIDEKILPIKTFGYTMDYELSHKINLCNISEFETLESSFGQNNYDSIKKLKFATFIKSYFYNYNKNPHKQSFNKFLKHLYVSKGTSILTNQKVKSVTVYFIKTIVKDHDSFVFYKKPIINIKIN